ncbi:MAG: cupredoxin domain-containing protein [Nitrosotalea sp.]
MKTPHLAIISCILVLLVVALLPQTHADSWGPLPSSYPQNKTMRLSFSYVQAGQSANGAEGSIHIKLFDARTDIPVKDTSFWMSVKRGDSQVMHTGFYTYSGSLTLNLQHGSDYQWIVAPDHDPMFVGGFESSSDTINVDVQPLAKDAMYHFEIEPAVFDEPKMVLFKPSGIKFDTYINATRPMQITILPERYTPPNLTNSNKTNPIPDQIVEIPNGTSFAECKARPCFIPDNITIKAGSQVTWFNHDAVGHTVTSGRPIDSLTGTDFDSGVISPGSSFNQIFSIPENFSYFDQVRPWITGNITVANASTPYLHLPNQIAQPPPALTENKTYLQQQVEIAQNQINKRYEKEQIRIQQQDVQNLFLISITGIPLGVGISIGLYVYSRKKR